MKKMQFIPTMELHTGLVYNNLIMEKMARFVFLEQYLYIFSLATVHVDHYFDHILEMPLNIFFARIEALGSPHIYIYQESKYSLNIVCMEYF